MLTFLPALTQEGALDVLDGETLYEDGWLFTAGYEFRLRRGLLDGADATGDPFHQREFSQAAVLSAHYGVMNTLQAGTVIPYVSHVLEGDGLNRLASSGIGDVTLYAKWRYYRWDDVGKAMNFSLLGGLELPTGRDDAVDRGVRLPADLQPGSASWDPFIGTAVTHEPGRWRFNAMALYKRVGEGTHNYKEADQVFAEIAAGNRFWLEPYPGPFMRADVMLRFRHEGADRQAGRTVADTGGDLLSLGVNWAFRPRPTLDLQISVEVPLFEEVRGVQLRNQVSVFFAFGFRI
ncbi:MAG: transporter [Planctomycetes bacterium]|nr:transporter [Planctomycetota bacterium]